MERKGNTYEEFDKITLANYSLERICLMNEAADRMFHELDEEVAENLEWDSTGEFDEKIGPYNWAEDVEWEE